MTVEELSRGRDGVWRAVTWSLNPRFGLLTGLMALGGGLIFLLGLTLAFAWLFAFAFAFQLAWNFVFSQEFTRFVFGTPQLTYLKALASTVVVYVLRVLLAGRKG